MFNFSPARALLSIILIMLMLTVTSCGNRIPHGLSVNSLNDEIAQYTEDHPVTSEWTVFVSHGQVTTNWLWFTKQHDVVYCAVALKSNNIIEDLTIKFGNKSFSEPALGGGGIFIIGFDITSSIIPSVMDIKWHENGRNHHIKIDSKSMIQLPFMDDVS